MQLSPRYGTDPVIVLDGDPTAIAEPTIRQRRRLAEIVSSFSDEQWAHPSRCEGWSNADVISHLDTTNTFWSFSIAAGLQGEPSQFLATFDPVATPAQLVAASTDTPAQVCKRFVASTRAFTNLLESLDDAAWNTLAEAPPGHLAISAMTHHALWDSWVHERDILLPLGQTQVLEDDEVVASLRYASALGPALALMFGATQAGCLTVDATGPAVELTVDVDGRVTVTTGATDAPLCLRGNAVDLLEALSIRRPLDQDIPTDAAWLLSGLAEAFDVAE